MPPKYPKAPALSHGEPKQLKQFMLTPTASAEIDLVADALDLSRSEALERAIKAGGMRVLLEGDALKKPLKLPLKQIEPPSAA